MKPVKAQQLLLICAMIAALNGCGRPWPPRPGEPTAPRIAMVSPRGGGSGSVEVEDLEVLGTRTFQLSSC